MKVENRHSPTMYMPHAYKNNTFSPVTDSAVLSEMVETISNTAKNSMTAALDVWERTFFEAQTLYDEIERGIKPVEEFKPIFIKLINMLISRHERIKNLAIKYFTFSDILYLKSRLIGTGFIGGKSVGMLLARAILRNSDKKWIEKLEVHDSYFIGSDVFGLNGARALMDNIRFSNVQRLQTIKVTSNDTLDINYSANTDFAIPVVDDIDTTAIYNFDTTASDIQYLTTLINAERGIFRFKIDVIDSFDKVIGNTDLENLLITLINTIKPAHCQAIISFLE